MNISVMPGKLKGCVEAIPSKSIAHRVLICAAFSDQPTLVRNIGDSKDVKETIAGLKALGVSFEEDEQGIRIIPTVNQKTKKSETTKTTRLCCQECGATLRMLLPVVAAVKSQAVISLGEALRRRPLEPLIEALDRAGKEITVTESEIHLSGDMKANSFSVVGNVSSQFISGLLLMAPLLKQDIIIEVTTEIESLPYVAMTCEIMKQFGVNVHRQGQRYIIKAGETYCSPKEIMIEGDWSSASYFLVAAALGSELTVKSLPMKTTQADRCIVDVLSQFGCELVESKEGLCVKRNGTSSSAAFRQIDLKDSPDLLPALAVLAGATPGVTMFSHVKRQRYKESDRIASCTNMLMNMGRRVQELEDELIITGGELTGGSIDSMKDHRIAMAAAIAGTVAKEGISIRNSQVVEKSYPQFIQDFKSVGGNVLQWN